MAKKEFTYRGRTIEELQGIGLEELSQLFKARARRKIKKGFTEQEKIFLRNLRASNKAIKTHCRDMIILPEMIGRTLLVYNGREFVAVVIQPEMLGHTLGEFALTRKKVGHSAPGVGATRSSAHVSVK